MCFKVLCLFFDWLISYAVCVCVCVCRCLCERGVHTQPVSAFPDTSLRLFCGDSSGLGLYTSSGIILCFHLIASELIRVSGVLVVKNGSALWEFPTSPINIYFHQILKKNLFLTLHSLKLNVLYGIAPFTT